MFDVGFPLQPARFKHLGSYLWLLGVAALTACNIVVPSFITVPPSGTSPLVGGITDVRPYFGKIKNSDNTDAGDFMLATCGCGDWRVLMQYDKGGQVQFPIHFFPQGAYVPTGSIVFYGVDGNNGANGTIDQDNGTLTASVQAGLFPHDVSAQRGDAHSLEIKACVLCHIGSNPIFPQPPNHPKYVPGVTDCFHCHTVVIN